LKLLQGYWAIFFAWILWYRESPMITLELKKVLQNFAQGSGRITILTGAGISAESGIPTFRGPEGYWTVGSKEYQPQEMATYRMFIKTPDEVWKWYLYRISICGEAKPNPGHIALVEMENLFKNRFTLITQNVDNLHLRAGNSLTNTFQIHGNIFFKRCVNECSLKVYPIPPNLMGKREKSRALTDTERRYDEHYYRFNSSLKVAKETELLIVVGTSGTTNLPAQIAWEVKQHGGIIVDVNVENNPFSNLALTSKQGDFIKGPSSRILPHISQIFKM
jgi:NAD-dependent deacetylase